MIIMMRASVFNFVLAMSLISLISIDSVVSTPASKDHHVSTFEQVGSWQYSRRLLQGDRDRPAPRGFPPPDGNALYHSPQRAPPGRRPWIPDDPPPLKIPPPHP